MLTDNQVKDLRSYLKKNHITQEEFANSLGIARNTVVRYLNQRLNPTKSILKLIKAITKGEITFE